MADMLKIKKGLVAKLSEQPKAPGTIYVATDEKTLYVDINDSENGRIRISGNLIMVENADDLKAPFSEDLIYFVENFTSSETGEKIAANALLKWTGNKFVQLNEAADFTAVNADITAAKNAADAAQAAADKAQAAADKAQGTADGAVTRLDAAETTIADHGTRLAAVEKKASDNAEDIKTANGEISTVKGKADANAEAITELTNTVSGNKTDIEGKLATETSERKAADAAINALLGTKANVEDGTAFEQIAALKAADTTLQGKIDGNTSEITKLTGVVTDNKTATDKAIADEVAAREAADTATNNLLGKKDDVANAEGTAFAQIAALKAADTTLKTSIDTNSEAIGTLKTGLSEANANITALDTRVGANETAIAAINEALGTDGGTGTSLTSRVGALETTVGQHGTTLTTHGESIDKNKTDIENLAKTVETNKTQAATDLAQAKTDLAAADAKTDANLAALTTRVTTAEGNITTHKDRLDALDTRIGTDIEAAKTELTKDINNKVNAVNAMTYKGAVANEAGLPKLGGSIDISIGDVYVFNANEVSDDGGRLHTAGDMAIAYSTDGDAGEVDNKIVSGLAWHYVETGYQRDQENSLVGEGNVITLKNFTGETLGDIKFAAVAEGDSGIVTTVADDTVSMSFQWGEF